MRRRVIGQTGKSVLSVRQATYRGTPDNRLGYMLKRSDKGWEATIVTPFNCPMYGVTVWRIRAETAVKALVDVLARNYGHTRKIFPARLDTGDTVGLSPNERRARREKDRAE